MYTPKSSRLRLTARRDRKSMCSLHSAIMRTWFGCCRIQSSWVYHPTSGLREESESLQSDRASLSLPYSKNQQCCWWAEMSLVRVSSSHRASRELDGHEGDPAGGHGVPAQVPGGHNGWAAQRRGAVCGCCQEDSGHGEWRHTLCSLFSTLMHNLNSFNTGHSKSLVNTFSQKMSFSQAVVIFSLSSPQPLENHTYPVVSPLFMTWLTPRWKVTGWLLAFPSSSHPRPRLTFRRGCN